jgi:L-threonylcarbamoyladenylate synthase
VDVATRLIKVDPDDPDPAKLEEAAAVLRGGGLVAFPTETVYGLGADASNPGAVARIYEAKGRPATNPLIVHAHDIGSARRAVRAWPLAAAKLALRFWPGPLTLVLPRSNAIADAVSAGLDTVGVRVPDSRTALGFLERAARPVAAPSANRSTGVSPTTAAHVMKDLDGRVDLVIDAGATHVGIESTVVDLTSQRPRLLRPGAITVGQIGRVLGVEVEAPAAPRIAGESAQTSPGQMEVHYAPRTSMHVFEPRQLRWWSSFSLDRDCGLIVAGRRFPWLWGLGTAFKRRVYWTDPRRAARELYSTLHDWDDGSLRGIYVVLPREGNDAWRAVRDRLWRASRLWARDD